MNWKNEAIEHLNRYTAMVQAVENIPQEINRLEQSAKGLRASRPDKVRAGKTPGPQDDVLIGNFIKREELALAYQNARIWVETTDRALAVLTDEEQTILSRMYIQPKRGVVNQLCNELGVEQSTVYRKRDNALYRFTMALYGAS